MASEIRVDKINSLSGVGTVTLSPTGVDIAGITTAATLRATTGIVTSLTAVSSAKVGSGVTLSPDGDIFATGVCTATTFSGSGASLTNLPAANITGTLPAISGANLTSLPAQATIANNADNRVITGGSGVNLNGEENLTWDGSTLTADKGSSNGTVLQLRNDDDTAYSSAAEGHLNSILSLQSTTPGGQNDQSVGIQFNLGLTGQTGSIQEIGAIRTGNGAGALIFRTRNSSSGRVERLRIASDGDVTISDGDLVIGTNGHGIDFSNASPSASSPSHNILDDYEEGTWTLGVAHDAITEEHGRYTKIGRMVFATFEITFGSSSNSSHQYITGLPFTSQASSDGGGNCGGVARDYQNYDIENGPIYHIQQNNTIIYFYKNNGATMVASNTSGYNFRGTAVYHAA